MNNQPPFAEFLQFLRDEGTTVSIAQYAALSRVLLRWRDIDRSQLRQAVVTILSTSLDESAQLKILFDQYFSTRTSAPHSSEAEPKVPPEGADNELFLNHIPKQAGIWTRLSRGLAIALLIVVLLPEREPRLNQQPLLPQVAISDMGSARTLVYPLDAGSDAAGESGALAPSFDLGTSADLGTNDQVTVAEPSVAHFLPTPSELPSPPLGTLTLSAIAGGLVLLWTSLLYYQRWRAIVRSRSAYQRAQSQLARLPGPRHYQLKISGLTPLSRELLEEAAILFGRIYEGIDQHRLDLEKIVKGIGETGYLAQFHFQRSEPASSILWLEELSESTQFLRPKLEALYQGLLTRGLPLDRWYFEGSLSKVYQDPLRLRNFSELAQESGSCPLVVVSCGNWAMEVGETLSGWLALLSRFPRRTWLNPIDDPRLWLRVLRRGDFPTRVWPITRQGLQGAASDLALPRTDAGSLQTAARSQNLVPVRRLTWTDVERLRELVAYAPAATPDLCEWLREKYCPDVPADALLFLPARGSGLVPAGVFLPKEEARRLRREALVRCPEAVQATKQAILQVHVQSEPREEASAAHLRWQLDRLILEANIQENQPVDLSGLAQSPLGHESVERAQALCETGTIPKKAEVAQLGPLQNDLAPADPARVSTQTLNQNKLVSQITLAISSFVIPGLGHALSGRKTAGLIWLLITCFGYVLFIVPGLILHVACVFSALRRSSLDQVGGPGFILLSLVIPGLGQMCAGQVWQGLLWLLVTALGYVCFIIPGIIMHIVCVLHAGRMALKQSGLPSRLEATFFSLLVPGLGQIGSARLGHGAIWLILTVVGYWIYLPAGIALHLACAIDAFNGARPINRWPYGSVAWPTLREFALGFAVIALFLQPQSVTQLTLVGCAEVRTRGICEFEDDQRMTLFVRGGAPEDVRILQGRDVIVDTDKSYIGTIHFSIKPNTTRLVVATMPFSRLRLNVLPVRAHLKPAWLKQAQALIEQGQRSDAETLLRSQLSGLVADEERSAAHGLLSTLYRLKGEFSKAEEALGLAIRESHAAGLLLSEMRYALTLSQLLSDVLGRPDEAERVLEDHRHLLTQVPQEYPYIAMLVAKMAQRRGDDLRALRSLQDGKIIAESMGNLPLIGALRVARAEVLGRVGKLDQAELKWLSAPVGNDDCSKADALARVGRVLVRAREIGRVDNQLLVQNDPVPPLTQAVALYHAGGPNEQLAAIEAQMDLATALLLAGSHNNAADVLLRIPREAIFNNPELALRQSELQGRLALAKALWSDAYVHFQQLNYIATKTSDKEAPWRARLGMAQAREFTDPNAALLLYRQAERYLEEQILSTLPPRVGQPERFERGARLLVDFLVRQNAAPEAMQTARRARLRGLLRYEGFRQRPRGLDVDETHWVAALSAYHNTRRDLEFAIEQIRMSPVDEQIKLERQRDGLEEQLLYQLDAAAELLPKSAVAPPLSEPEAEEAILLCYPGRVEFLCFCADQSGVRVSRVDLSGAPDSQLALRILSPFRSELERASRLRIIPYGPLYRIDLNAVPFPVRPLGERLWAVHSMDFRRPGQVSITSQAPGRAVMAVNTLHQSYAQSIIASVVDQFQRAGWQVNAQIDFDKLQPQEKVSELLLRADLLHYLGLTAYNRAGMQSLITADGFLLTTGDVLLASNVPKRAVLIGDGTGWKDDASSGIEALTLVDSFLLRGSEWVIGTAGSPGVEEAVNFSRLLYQNGLAETPSDPVAAMRKTWQAAPNGFLNHFKLYVP